MLLGTFDSITGIYKIKDRHFKSIWYANSLREPNIKTIYNTCITGFNSSHSDMPNWPKSVFVTYAPGGTRSNPTIPVYILNPSFTSSTPVFPSGRSLRGHCPGLKMLSCSSTNMHPGRLPGSGMNLNLIMMSIFSLRIHPRQKICRQLSPLRSFQHLPKSISLARSVI